MRGIKASAWREVLKRGEVLGPLFFVANRDSSCGFRDGGDPVYPHLIARIPAEQRDSDASRLRFPSRKLTEQGGE